VKRTLFIAIVIALLVGCTPTTKEAPAYEPQRGDILATYTLLKDSPVCAEESSIRELIMAVAVDDMPAILELYKTRRCGITIDDFVVTVVSRSGDTIVEVDAQVYEFTRVFWTLSDFFAPTN
jgi:hypothetical protein